MNDHSSDEQFYMSVAQALEHDMESLYIVSSACAFAAIAITFLVALLCFTVSAFNVIVSIGVSLIILAISSNSIHYQKNRLYTRTLKKLTECQSLSSNEDASQTSKDDFLSFLQNKQLEFQLGFRLFHSKIK